jgi:hypothetical protein
MPDIWASKSLVPTPYPSLHSSFSLPSSSPTLLQPCTICNVQYCTSRIPPSLVNTGKCRFNQRRYTTWTRDHKCREIYENGALSFIHLEDRAFSTIIWRFLTPCSDVTSVPSVSCSHNAAYHFLIARWFLARVSTNSQELQKVWKNCPNHPPANWMYLSVYSGVPIPDTCSYVHRKG